MFYQSKRSYSLWKTKRKKKEVILNLRRPVAAHPD